MVHYRIQNIQPLNHIQNQRNAISEVLTVASLRIKVSCDAKMWCWVNRQVTRCHMSEDLQHLAECNVTLRYTMSYRKVKHSQYNECSKLVQLIHSKSRSRPQTKVDIRDATQWPPVTHIYSDNSANE